MQWKWLFFEPIKIFQSKNIQKNKTKQKQKTKPKESFPELKNIQK